MDATCWRETTQVSITTVKYRTGGLTIFKDEGPSFVPRNITTEDLFVQWVRDTLPEFGENDIAKVLLYYPSSNTTDNPDTPEFATSGSSGPSALNQSSIATGQQQRANVCTYPKFCISNTDECLEPLR